MQAQVWSQLSRQPESSKGFAFSEFPLVFTGKFCHSLVICPPSGSAGLHVRSSGLAGAAGLGSCEPTAWRQTAGFVRIPGVPSSHSVAE